MKILLIEPTKPPIALGGEDVHLYEPLALEYVAAGVSKEHEVKILDLRIDKDLQGTLKTFCPDIVGITSYTVHVNTVRRLFQEIKQQNPGLLTVAGGHHATVAPEDFLSPHIDVIVIGEGVFAFKEIVARREKGEGLQGIPGTALPKGDQLIITEPSPMVDLDALPFPDRQLTAKYRKRYYGEWMKPLASIRTSKGCPHRCSFCSLWKLTGGRYLRRDPERIVEELATLQEKFVFFADDESLVDAPRMKRLAELIKEAGIKKRYFLYGRSDTIARNPELLAAWRGIGLDRIFVGLEFFRDQDMEYIRKGSTIDDNNRAVKVLRDLGIDLYASFIVRPEFTREDFAALRKYCRDLGTSFAVFAVLTPLPGADLYEESKDRLLTHNYDYVDFIHTLLPTTLPLKEFYAEYLRLFTKGIPATRQLASLRKYQWKEIPSLLFKGRRFYGRLRKAYLDYDEGLQEHH